jgi:hypothetical protein
MLFLAETEGIWYFLGNLKGGMGENILFHSASQQQTVKGEVKPTGGNQLISKATAGFLESYVERIVFEVLL